PHHSANPTIDHFHVPDPTTPKEQALWVWAVPRSLATTRGISVISFPLGTKMFQFPRFPSPNLCVQFGDTAGSLHWLSPFGHLRSKACSRLPGAYRSGPRPSSAFCAKASTVSP